MKIKYSIVNGLAYTTDNVLIQNLYVSSYFHALDNITGQLNDFFKQIDENSHIQLQKNFQRFSTFCILYLSSAEIAAKVLENYKTVLFVGNVELTVSPCPSYYQPEGTKLIKQIDAILEAEASSDSDLNKSTNLDPLIFNLNDDCLETICKQLCDLDQINFALSCKCFWFILQLGTSSKYKVLDTRKLILEWPMLKVKHLFQLVGGHIKRILLTDDLINLDLDKYCSNVEKLRVNNVTYVQKLQKMVENMPNLKELQSAFTLIDDDFIQNLNTLKKLYIFGSNCLTFTNNQLPSDLEVLSIASCAYFSATSLRNICVNLKNLSYLEIKNIHVNLKTEDYKYISENLVQLTVLKIEWSEGQVNYLQQLKNLKELEIGVRPENIQTDFAFTFCEFINDRLEKFQIRINSGNFNRTQAFHVITLQKLKFLYIDSCSLTGRRVLRNFAELEDMEEFSLRRQYNCIIFFEDILELVKYCLKLKRISIYNIDDERCLSVLLTEIEKLLKKNRLQRSHNLHIDIYLKYNCQYLHLRKCYDNLKLNIKCEDLFE